MLTTTVTALRWPTKSILVFQPSLSTIWAVGPELFMAWADTRYWPSGDQDRRRTWVVPPHWDTHRREKTIQTLTGEPVPVAGWAGGCAGVTKQKQRMHEMHDECRGFHASIPAVTTPTASAHTAESCSLFVPHWRVWWCWHPSASPLSSTLWGCGRQPGRRCTSPLDPRSDL